MTISHVQPILLLLASLFFLPVLLGDSVDFKYCDKTGNDYADVNNVVAIWDTPGHSILIFVDGSSKKNIPGKKTSVCVSEKTRGAYMLKTYDLCDVTKCNTKDEIEAGTTFQLMLDSVPFIEHVGYEYSISVGGENCRKPTIMCVDFKLNTLDDTLVSA